MRRATPILAVMCVMALSYARAEAPAVDPYPGAWMLTVTPDSPSEQKGARLFETAVVFESETFSSEAFGPMGFCPQPYTLSGQQNPTFSVTLSNPTQGTLQWSGQLTGGKLTGTLCWTKANGKVLNYSFSGPQMVISSND